MEQVETAQELGHGKPKPSYEWEAGATPPGDSAPGRWAVVKRPQDWAVMFRSDKGAEYIIHTFPLSDAGERAGKIMATKLVEIAWGKTGVEKASTVRKENPPQPN
jgi:hypothetical protein